ncbi:phosphoethanolamine--lipid A transferase EptA [Chryseobacterium sp. Ch-15]|uniref:Phosphoethanolamine--lipid A transferase EptA n=1 Tax=Chryseobacterium muglaense TaxID=2893752 RepID=A0A9Q3YXH5_9FLAO|nr:phosphoethanolamine--lipid A transferase EptA [Chryseobacterium muglaense]MBD3906469.1 phosphoethanolamine--lipid A transferase EptA [Chryseobacterium muglaense]MCC9036820.1 phosphoethanolamine--lipid A transferase EptA [Chryseobacterium muglaense]MCM2556146.1 phosphoethanolamine--lipid A transferase EptA [Chryseobacterium muglaense]
MLKNKIKFSFYVLGISVLNSLLFHLPFFKFVLNNIDYHTFVGGFMVFSLFLMAVVANFFAFYMLLFRSGIVGRILMCIIFLINAVALYFINTYGVIIDESMIGNVLNTNYAESSSFFSFKLLGYLIFLGFIPGYFILTIQVVKESVKKCLLLLAGSLLFILVFVFANSSNWLWIDKNSKTLGGLVMPWSYTVNTALFYIHKNQTNRKEILLPKATMGNNDKAVVILVIGESARQENFSLYGYGKNTNPLLSKIDNVHTFRANSCATYTTAGVKCILQHQDSNDFYEILPNYLYRNNVDVVWRTTNWGEPPVHVRDYQTRDKLMRECNGEDCGYDEILVSGLKERISASRKNKVLIVLHTSTSHGPTYNKKYPKKFEVFSPVCNSVELSKCSRQELINAYDNTIVYTDYILSQVIGELKELKGYRSSMIYVSDHGESLGEKNLYMHGLPVSLAPKQQYEIPFIVWSSGGPAIKNDQLVSQSYVFHSVLRFLGVKSPVYDEKMSIFK